MRPAQDMCPGTQHETNTCGKLTVVAYYGSKDVQVKFVLTGYTRTASAHEIRRGRVLDPYYPRVHGVGFIGEGVNHTHPAYHLWAGMLERCYTERYPSYLGCTVNKQWHNFQNFAEWYDLNYIEGFELDKDIKVKGNTEYGPDTCAYVSRKDNVIEAHALNFKFLNPTGELVEIYNLAEFSRVNGLDASCMTKVHMGKRKSHKGYKKYE